MPSIRTLVLALLAVTTAHASAAEPAEPRDYRMARYDAPVPRTLQGAVRVDAPDVARLMREHDAVVIDVVPAIRRPESLRAADSWMPVPHEGIAGSVWLPDTGYGALSRETERYFRLALERLTGGDAGHPLVFYCRMDCWMSWNAAKRATAWGYGAVHWFPDGIDGWRFEDLPVAVLEPEPGTRHGDRSPDRDRTAATHDPAEPRDKDGEIERE